MPKFKFFQISIVHNFSNRTPCICIRISFKLVIGTFFNRKRYVSWKLKYSSILFKKRFHKSSLIYLGHFYKITSHITKWNPFKLTASSNSVHRGKVSNSVRPHRLVHLSKTKFNSTKKAPFAHFPNTFILKRLFCIVLLTTVYYVINKMMNLFLDIQFKSSVTISAIAIKYFILLSLFHTFWPRLYLATLSNLTCYQANCYMLT